MNFCTLFDSYYLDKGITLYKSLEKVSKDFKLFIFCFDDKSKEVLLKENFEHAVILSHEDLEKEYDNLLELKKQRSKAEYCWTCTPASIDYVLKHFDVDSCIYIDADLYFFADPVYLENEINEAKADIVITPHRFTSSLKDKRFLRRSGKYCVEFNYFNKSDNAKEALNWWKEKCFEWCFHLYEPERMGDQKYLEKFPVLFKGVHELKSLGGGVAPWNFAQYTLKDKSNEHIYLKDKKSGEDFLLVFYHFQDIRYLPGRKVNIKSNSHDKEMKYCVYKPYLKAIEETRRHLSDEYNIDFCPKKSYSSNKLISFLQKNVLQYKVKSLSDIISLDE